MADYKFTAYGNVIHCSHSINNCKFIQYTVIHMQSLNTYAIQICTVTIRLTKIIR